MKSVRVDNQTVTIEVYEAASRLDQPALMGDTGDEAYYSLDAFPGVDPNKRDTPIPFVVGPFSRYSLLGVLSGIIKRVDPEFTNKATCITFVPEPAQDECRQWGLYRSAGTGADNYRLPNFGTPTTINHSGGVVLLTYNSGAWSNAALDFDYGDSAKVTHSGDNYSGVVTIIDPTNRQVTLQGYEDIAATGNLTGATIVGQPAPAIWIYKKDNSVFYPTPMIYDRDYYLGDGVTSGGNTFHQVIFYDDFETNYPGVFNTGDGEYLHPNNFEVLYRARPKLDNANHADLLQSMCEKSGLAVDAASFAASKSALDAFCFFQIPQFDETDFHSYRDYVQLILQSTLGILYVNNDFEAVYELLAAPSPAADAMTNPSIYMRDSLRIEHEYQDIVDQIVAYNAHNVAQPIKGYTQSSSTTAESIKARHLHGINNVTRFRHVLNDISGRLQTILDIRSTRRATYRFKTATKHLDAQIGDDMTLESPLLPGGAASIDLKILSLDKSLDDTEVEATDLEEI
jgi:hypothetical protein